MPLLCSNISITGYAANCVSYNQNITYKKGSYLDLKFNGYYPLYYAQFKNLIGMTSKMQIVIPANKDVSGYDSILYQLYFDLEK